MLKHYFSQRAVRLSPEKLAAILAERLRDMGYVYNSITSSNLNSGAGVKSGNPYKSYYDYQGDDDASDGRKVALLTLSGPDLATLESSSVIKFTVLLDDGGYRVEEEITVSDLLARPHPHPFRSWLGRLERGFYALFEPPFTPTISD